MGETANALGGMSIAQAQEEIARASATADGKISSPLDPPADVVRPPMKPLFRDISQLEASPSPLSSGVSLASSMSPRAPSLAKSSSTTSVGCFSTRSHVSVPVTGSIPYGTLRIHRPADTPQTASTTESKADPIVEASPSPTGPLCLDSGDVFLVLELPESFTVGLDTVALSTVRGNQFRGFRDIPPGAHLLWVSEPSALIRCGYWFVTTEKKEIRVKQWDRYNETLGETASQFELRDQRDNIESVHANLIPYDFERSQSNGQPDEVAKSPTFSLSSPSAPDSASIWQELTSCITTTLLERVTGKKNVTEWLLDTTDTAKGELHFPQQPNKLLKTFVDGTELNFLFSPDVVDLQLLNLTNVPDFTTDTTAQIVNTLGRRSASPDLSGADLVGELQFAFLTGVHLGNSSCLEQWWHLVLKVILRAHQLAISYPTLCRTLLSALLAQMTYNDRYFAKSGGDDRLNGNGHDSGHEAAAAAAALSVPAGDGSGSILEVMPQYRAKLREALTVYKRRLNEALLGLDLDSNNDGADRISPEQAAVGQAFADLEAWFWKLGWDLRSDYVHERPLDGLADEDDEDDMLPVVVQLDASGREVGLVSF